MLLTRKIKFKVIFWVITLFVIMAIVLTFDSVKNMISITSELTTSMYSERLRSYLSVTDMYINSYYGSIVKVEEEIVDSSGNRLYGTHEMVDKINMDLDIIASIYAKKNDDFVRISTTLKGGEGERIIGSDLSYDHPVRVELSKLQEGEITITETYVGEVNFLTGFKPLFTSEGELYACVVLAFPLTYIERKKEEIRADMIRDLIKVSGYLLIGFCIIIYLGLVYFLKPINETINLLKDLVSKGADLKSRLKIERKDEMGELSYYFNNILGELYSIVTHIIKNAQDVDQKSIELSTVATLLIENAVSMNNRSLNISAIIDELDYNTSEIMSFSEISSDSVESVAASSESLTSIINDLAVLSETLNLNVHYALTSIEKLEQHLEGIKDKIGEKNMLKLQDYIKTISTSINEPLFIFGKIANDLFIAAKSSNEITDKSITANRSSKEIAQLTKEINKNLSDITKNMSNMLFEIHNTTYHAETTKKASDELYRVAAELNKKSEVFSVIQKSKNPNS